MAKQPKAKYVVVVTIETDGKPTKKRIREALDEALFAFDAYLGPVAKDYAKVRIRSVDFD